MSDPSSALLDDASSTPLHLLLNAISETGDGVFGHVGEGMEGELNLGGLLAASREVEGSEHLPSSSRKRANDQVGDGVASPRQHKIARTLASHAMEASNITLSPADVAFSTVEVWHPRTAQKSYGKERRMLNPPPILRVTGPLLPLLTSATLSVSQLPPTNPVFPVASDSPRSIPVSSQTHAVALSASSFASLLPPAGSSPVPDTTPPSRPGLKSKKAEREEEKRRVREQAIRHGFLATLPGQRANADERDREELSEGLAFPGLWVAEVPSEARTKAGKSFRLELKLGEPGVESKPTDSTPHTPGIQEGVISALDTTLRESSIAFAEPHAAPGGSKSWATLVSSDITIVSKPSQKTAKARSMESCLSERDTVALWARINAQTVRTKYMRFDASATASPKLSARTGQWTPFRFEVVRRAVPPVAERGRRHKLAAGSSEEVPVAEAGVLTYGSEVRLVDVRSGAMSEVVKLVKVEKGETVLGEDEGHPVSELQRVGFARVEGEAAGEGSRWYLSAPGARLGGGELLPWREVEVGKPGGRSKPLAKKEEMEELLQAEAEVAGPEHPPDTLEAAPQVPIDPAPVEDTTGTDNAPTGSEVTGAEGPTGTAETLEAPEGEKTLKRRRTRRHALAKAVVQEEEGGAADLVWVRAERGTRQVVSQGIEGEAIRLLDVEKVEDWMCWAIGGVSSFTYTFFDAESPASLPAVPLDPVSRLLADPIFHPASNTLELILADFPPSDAANALQLFLGPMGPLRYVTFMSSAHAEKGYPETEKAATPCEAAGHWVGGATAYSDRRPPDSWMSSFPAAKRHVIVVVEMPPAEEITRVMQECWVRSVQPVGIVGEAEPGRGAAPPSVQPQQGDSGGDSQQPIREETPPGWLHDAVAAAASQQTTDDAAAAATEITLQEALRHAQELGGFGQDGAMPLDPSLAGVTADDGTAENDKTGSAAANGGAGEGEEEEKRPVLMSVPEKEEKRTELCPLPLLLVRKDGVGFGLGRSVAAESMTHLGEHALGLRVVEST